MKFKEYHIDVPGDQDESIRLDKYIALNIAELSRTKVKKAIKNGTVKINGVVKKPSYRINPGDIIKVKIPKRKPPEAKPEKIDLDIIYEDEDIIVVNKSGDRVVHPAHGNWSDTLVNGLLWHANNLSKKNEDTLRPGIVHRLDKDTSGLLVVAKTDEAHRVLSSYFQDKSIERTYRAIVWGTPNKMHGTITGNIGRNPRDRKKMAVVPDGSGKHAITHYKVLEYFDHLTLLEIRLETGRTHQIRVHLAEENHWVLCDRKYGGDSVRYGSNTGSRKQMFKNIFSTMKRQCLHAKTLAFDHPRTGEFLEFDSDLPDDFRQVLDKLRANCQPKNPYK